VSTCKTRRNKTKTPLPQTDRATRRRSKSGRNKLYNESRTNRSDAQLQGYSRQTCNKLYTPGHEASTITGVIHKLDRRRILTTPPTCRGEIILVQSSGDISTQKTCKIVFKQSLRKYCQKSFRDVFFCRTLHIFLVTSLPVLFLHLSLLPPPSYHFRQP